MNPHTVNTRSALAKARNHGAAGAGVAHWWRMKISAILLLALTAWLLFAINVVSQADFAEARLFLAQPWHTCMALLFSWSIFYHAQLGLQVVIEDYVHTHWVATLSIITVRLLALLLATLCSVLILSLALAPGSAGL